MKLKNKKTGEIVSLQGELLYDDKVRLLNYYGSLAEFNEEWEDMPEEPKGIKSVGTIGSSVHIEFKTEEEAIKAKEHLLAWQRLKDKGFRFNGADAVCISYETDIEYHSMQDLQDFKMLFGGEDDKRN